MNNIQKMMDNLKYKKSKALQEAELCRQEMEKHFSEARAFDFAIDEAEKLLNAETQATVKKP